VDLPDHHPEGRDAALFCCGEAGTPWSRVSRRQQTVPRTQGHRLPARGKITLTNGPLPARFVASSYRLQAPAAAERKAVPRAGRRWCEAIHERSAPCCTWVSRIGYMGGGNPVGRGAFWANFEQI
jgi:hypothetical protein